MRNIIKAKIKNFELLKECIKACVEDKDFIDWGYPILDRINLGLKLFEAERGKDGKDIKVSGRI